MEEKTYIVRYVITVSAKDTDAAEMLAWAMIVRDEARPFVTPVEMAL